ncbi:UNVERIFIED_CONTAM: hypothetical protein FKN15_060876 [Acipenser sinensis]
MVSKRCYADGTILCTVMSRCQKLARGDRIEMVVASLNVWCHHHISDANETNNAQAGTNASALEKDIGQEQFPINEHYFGLVNFGNTCYCNSVLQALYFCRPFRENVLAYKAQQKKKENLLTCLADLFHSITTQKKKVGVIPPKKFISRLRKENDLFDNYMQQDAHEFLNYLLNTVADILQEETTQEKQNGKLKNGSTTSDAEESNKVEPTWVHDIFQGTLTNETRCLNCETKIDAQAIEEFYGLTSDISKNSESGYILFYQSRE